MLMVNRSADMLVCVESGRIPCISSYSSYEEAIDNGLGTFNQGMLVGTIALDEEISLGKGF